jgi:hypothetical protein
MIARCRLLLPARIPQLGEHQPTLPVCRAVRASSSQSAREGAPNPRGDGRPEWAEEISDEELQKHQQPLRLAVKILVASWISYKAYCYTMDRGGLCRPHRRTALLPQTDVTASLNSQMT